MKIVKRIAGIIACIPMGLIVLWIAFEALGMMVNHTATGMQTRKLKNMIGTELTSSEIIDTYSETGNTSGTGNHVDMLSVVVFRTDDSLSDIENKLQDHHRYDYCDDMDIPEQLDHCYLLYVNENAPFADNIEGH